MSGIFVLDTNSLQVFGNYYPQHFPSFWHEIQALIDQGRLVSVSEVREELENGNASEHLAEWVNEHPTLFSTPTSAEMNFVAEIFRVAHFGQLIGERQRLKGMPMADPFLIARAHVLDGCVVSEESLKPHAAKIPNVCEHFGVRYQKVQGFLGEVGWQF